MRKIIPFLIVGILVLSGLGASANSQKVNSNKKIEKTVLDFSKPIIEEQTNFINIELENTNSYVFEPGKPILPAYTQDFTFPLGTKIIDIKCEKTNIQEQIISKKLINAPTPVIAGSTLYKQKEIEIKDPYPENNIDYKIGEGIKDGKRSLIVKTQINPVKYYPEEQKIKWATNIKITIEYVEIPQTQTIDEEYKFVIITPGKYNSELFEFVNHKIDRGITTKLVTLNEVYSGYYFPVEGEDDIEKIKYFIKNTIDNWGTTDVMLIGGIEDFPARETHIKLEDEEEGNHDEEIFVSDLYYADIYQEGGVFCSWDSNDNNVYGEYNWGESGNYDEMDLFPDVRIGRLAATTSTELSTILNKIINYENNKAYTKNWFNEIVVIGGDSAPNDQELTEEPDVDEGELVNQEILDIMDGFIPDIIWDSNNKLSGRFPNPTGVDNIDNAINEGCGFVDWSGHGSPTVWTTYPHNVNRQILPTPNPPGLYFNYYNSDLTNGDELPIVMCGGCSLGKYQADDECFAWTYLTNPNGGGIASFGATGLGYIYIGKYVTYGLVEGFMINLYEAYDDGAITLGEMWNNAVNRYMPSELIDADYKTLTELHMFGDPTLAISEESTPPAKPNKPNGPPSGNVGTSYTFTASTTDIDDDDIAYLFDWGDGTFSEWTDLISSGDIVSISHSWDTADEFNVRVKAKDEHGKQSEWSDTSSVSIPKSKFKTINLIDRLIEIFPNLFLILKIISEKT